MLLAECYELLGLRARPSLADVNSAFRSKAIMYHPDKCGERADGYSFPDLVYARDAVIASLTEPSVSDDSDAWYSICKQIFTYSKAGFLTLLEQDSTYHVCALQIAYALHNKKWIERIRNAMSVYYRQRVRVIKLCASLQEAIDGSVRIWWDDLHQKNIFIPLWYPSLFFEDECLLFHTTLSHRGWLVEVCSDTHNVKLCKDDDSILEIHIAGKVFHDSDRVLHGRGLYAPCDDDIYSTEARANIEIVT